MIAEKTFRSVDDVLRATFGILGAGVYQPPLTSRMEHDMHPVGTPPKLEEIEVLADRFQAWKDAERGDTPWNGMSAMERHAEAALVAGLTERELPPAHFVAVIARYLVARDPALTERKEMAAAWLADNVRPRLRTHSTPPRDFVVDVVRRWANLKPTRDDKTWAGELGISVRTVERWRRQAVRLLWALTADAADRLLEVFKERGLVGVDFVSGGR